MTMRNQADPALRPAAARPGWATVRIRRRWTADQTRPRIFGNASASCLASRDATASCSNAYLAGAAEESEEARLSAPFDLEALFALEQVSPLRAEGHGGVAALAAREAPIHVVVHHADGVQHPSQAVAASLRGRLHAGQVAAWRAAVAKKHTGPVYPVQHAPLAHVPHRLAVALLPLPQLDPPGIEAPARRHPQLLGSSCRADVLVVESRALGGVQEALHVGSAVSIRPQRLQCA
eukprot:scaffold7029_cov375-Pinguiococcus_pyrenoidosus.AAC.21